MTAQFCTRLLGTHPSTYPCGREARAVQFFDGDGSRPLCADCARVVTGQAREHGLECCVRWLEGVEVA